IVEDCLRDGQFDDCDLTMRDLAIIVDTLERTVSNIYHHRIDYPGFEFNRGARRRSTEAVDAAPSRPSGSAVSALGGGGPGSRARGGPRRAAGLGPPSGRLPVCRAPPSRERH